MEQHQSGAHEIERAGPERVERVLEDVVLDDLEVRNLEPREVTGVDVGRNHLSRRTDLLGEPYRHRATPCSDLETTPPGLNQCCASQARARIVDLLEEIQPLILSDLPACCGEAIVESLRGPSHLLRLCHARDCSPRDEPGANR